MEDARRSGARGDAARRGESTTWLHAGRSETNAGEQALHPQDQSKPQYGLLCDVLDVILTFSDKGASHPLCRAAVADPPRTPGHADATLPLSSIQSLVEMQTISGCHQVFAYIEMRVDRLTKVPARCLFIVAALPLIWSPRASKQDMHPTRGKGPLLLRLLNELLRRLPKSKADDVIFSGRILMFLSSVFPLGEKSGVNLRGNFNTGKGTVFEDKEEVVEQTKGEGEAGEDKMEDVKLTDARASLSTRKDQREIEKLTSRMNSRT